MLKYFLDSYKTNANYYLPFAKIIKNNTIFDEKFSHILDNHKGIYIDIFPLDNVQNNNFAFRVRAVISKAITDTLAYKYHLLKLKRALHPCISGVLSVLSKKSLIKLQNAIVTYCKDDNSKYMCDIAFGYGYQKELVERIHVLPTRKLSFAGKKYSCMKDDTFLKNVYGDYMEIPSEDKRKSHKPLKIDFGGKDE